MSVSYCILFNPKNGTELLRNLIWLFLETLMTVAQTRGLKGDGDGEGNSYSCDICAY